jgi:hypothetical protein
MKEMGPSTRAVYLVPCGHAFAEVAITEIQESSCPECGEAFEKENIMTILPTTEKDVQRVEKRLEGLREKGLTHSLKKDKSDKKNKKKRKGDDAAEPEAVAGKKDADQPKKTADARISGINNPMAASLTAKVLAEQDERNKRRKLVSDRVSRNGEVVKG